MVDCKIPSLGVSSALWIFYIGVLPNDVHWLLDKKQMFLQFITLCFIQGSLVWSGRSCLAVYHTNNILWGNFLPFIHVLVHLKLKCIVKELSSSNQDCHDIHINIIIFFLIRINKMIADNADAKLKSLAQFLHGVKEISKLKGRF